MTPLPATAVALEARGVTQRFGGLLALADVSFPVAPGRVHGLIGPNGAGKTTLLNILTGLQRPTSGAVFAHDTDVTRWPSHRLVMEAGIVRTFQTVKLFATMTVEENLLVAARRTAGKRAARGVAHAALERLGLGPFAGEQAANLAYGLQRRVELARAVASGPRILLLDEPAAGLNPIERVDLGGHIAALAADGVALLLVEHHMDLVRSVCEHTVVLDFGRIIASGPTSDVVTDPRVVEAYLGVPEEESA